MTEGLTIRGGAGAAEAAAIAAVIAKVVSDEQTAGSAPGARRPLSDWVMAGRSEQFIPPRAPSKAPRRPA